MFSKNVYHLSFSSRYLLNAALLRVGEGYEDMSPALETYEDALDYRCAHLRLDRWSGCCLSVQDAKYSLLHYYPTLVRKERLLWEKLKTLDADGLLVCTDASNPDKSLLAHELVHACYSDNAKYRRTVNKIVDSGDRAQFKSCLRELEYGDVSHYRDEVNAYALTGLPRRARKKYAKSYKAVTEGLHKAFESAFHVDLRTKKNWNKLYDQVYPLGCLE